MQNSCQLQSSNNIGTLSQTSGTQKKLTHSNSQTFHQKRSFTWVPWRMPARLHMDWTWPNASRNSPKAFKTSNPSDLGVPGSYVYTTLSSRAWPGHLWVGDAIMISAGFIATTLKRSALNYLKSEQFQKPLGTWKYPLKTSQPVWNQKAFTCHHISVDSRSPFCWAVGTHVSPRCYQVFESSKNGISYLKSQEKSRWTFLPSLFFPKKMDYCPWLIFLEFLSW